MPSHRSENHPSTRVVFRGEQGLHKMSKSHAPVFPLVTPQGSAAPSRQLRSNC
nr:MAG TPA: hypothetical protein [Caudoviricetes sp.]